MKETPSIFNRKKPKEESATTGEVLPTRSEAFTEADLQEAMGQFRSMKMSQELGETESLVINRAVRLGQNQIVIIELASSLEGNILERFEVELTGYLRKTLRNDNVKLEKEVNTPDQSKKLYTSKDKYEYMVKKNPALKDLKDRLGLDFDY